MAIFLCMQMRTHMCEDIHGHSSLEIIWKYLLKGLSTPHLINLEIIVS